MAFLPEELSPPTLPSLLEALLKEHGKNISNRYYKGQTINLDGYTFTNCCFHNCILVTYTGTFSLNSCTTIDCTKNFGHNAVRIIKLFNALNPSPWPGFNPLKENDGAITIK